MIVAIPFEATALIFRLNFIFFDVSANRKLHGMTMVGRMNTIFKTNRLSITYFINPLSDHFRKVQCETKKSNNGIRRNRVSFEAYTHTFQGIHLQRQDIKFNLAKWKRTQKFYPPHFRCYILPR